MGVGGRQDRPAGTLGLGCQFDWIERCLALVELMCLWEHFQRTDIRKNGGVEGKTFCQSGRYL